MENIPTRFQYKNPQDFDSTKWTLWVQKQTLNKHITKVKRKNANKNTIKKKKPFTFVNTFPVK